MATEKPELPNEPTVAILAVTSHGVDLALRIQARLGRSVCYVPRRHRFAVTMGAVPFDRLAAVFPEVWQNHSAMVCIMATGIAVRLIAPLVRHKTTDPAVVVLDERGDFVISLLSGHLGGANDLARRVAAITGGQPVITTATDVRGKPALDLIAREKGLEIENLETLGRIARALLEEEPVWLHDVENRLSPELDADIPGVRPWSGEAGGQEQSREPTVGVWVSETGPQGGPEWLILRPRNLVVGVGCNRGTPGAEILELVRAVFRAEGISVSSIRNLASVDLKADEEGLLSAAQELDRPIEFFSRSELQDVEVPNPSTQVEEHIGVRSVCEAAAIRSAVNGRLVVTKRKTPNVTLAVARVAYPS
jgi:cobalt-precorrin 5A hydrolase